MDRLRGLAFALLAMMLSAMSWADAAVVTERPVILEPSGPVGLPVVFSWTPISGGNLQVHATGGRRRSTVLPAPTYELQISNRADVGSNVLVEVSTPTASFFFTNNFPATNFTVRADGPLPGGVYYFRVRARFDADTTSEYSSIGSFTLESATGGASAGIHDYSITSIESVGTLVAGVPGAIVVRVRNTGSFPENSGTVTLTYGGTRAGSASVPPLAPGESALLEYAVAPAKPGLAEVDARLIFADGGTANNALSKTIEVRAANATATSLYGRIRAGERGFVLVDLQGRVRADLVAAGVDFARYAGQVVTAAGTLTSGKDRFTLTVRSVVPDPGVK